jgi:predicted metal-dependent hydrolase
LVLFFKKEPLALPLALPVEAISIPGQLPKKQTFLPSLLEWAHSTAVKMEQAESLDLPGGAATVQWRRSRRARRISLRIDARDGTVVVTLPMRVARAAGVALLKANAAWVADRLAALPPPLEYAAGSLITIDGVPHRIVHTPDGRGGAWLEAGVLHVSGDPAFLARRVGDFLRAEARRRFASQALAKAASAGLSVRRVSVRDTRTRWGSCSANGTLMFCWRLLMAPPYVQDYVVAHEVAHLRHMNHGADFWQLTNALSPHRAQAVAWLSEQGAGLMRVG